MLKRLNSKKSQIEFDFPQMLHDEQVWVTGEANTSVDSTWEKL